MKPITVLLVDDHNMVREGFRLLLQNEDDIEVIGEAENGRQAIELARKLKPAVIVMDLSMPLLNGLEATRQIHHALPRIKVLILSAHDDDAYVDQMSELCSALNRSGSVGLDGEGGGRENEWGEPRRKRLDGP